VLYVCIPVHNEAATIGVLLWRIRTVLQEYARDYEVVVYDDGSTDETPDVLEPYRKVLPLTVLRGEHRLGTAGAVESLCRYVVSHTRYPRRDGAVLMQGDFTDRPEDLPELSRRFEGGADLILGRRAAVEAQPEGERRLRQWAPRVLRLFLRVPDVDDLITSYRVVRISVLRDALRARGDGALAQGAGWTALVDFALAVTPYARRVEMVDLPGRYDLRPRVSRLDWWSELRALAGYAWRARGRRVTAGDRIGDRPERAERPERVERTAERIADGALDGSPERPSGPERMDRPERPARAARERRPADRPARAAEGESMRAPHRGRAVEGPVVDDAVHARAPRPPRPERVPAAGEEERPAAARRARRAERALDTAGRVNEPGTQREAPRPGPRRERSPEGGAVDAAAGATGSVSTPPTAPFDLSEGPVPPETIEMEMPGGDGAPRKRARRRRRRGSRAEGAEGASGGEDGIVITDETGDSSGQPSLPVEGRAAAAEPSGSFGEASDAAADVAGAFVGGAGDAGEPGDGAEASATTRRRRRRRRSRGDRTDGGADGGEGDAQAASGTDGRDGVALHQVELHEPVERAAPPDRATD
jgi:hypothetical protein